MRPNTLQRGFGITGVSVGNLRSLAHLYGKTTPSFIRIGNGIQHHDNGGMIRTRDCSCRLSPTMGNSWRRAVKEQLLCHFEYTRDSEAGLAARPLPRSINMNRLGDVLLNSTSSQGSFCP